MLYNFADTELVSLFPYGTEAEIDNLVEKIKG